MVFLLITERGPFGPLTKFSPNAAHPKAVMVESRGGRRVNEMSSSGPAVRGQLRVEQSSHASLHGAIQVVWADAEPTI